MPAILVPMKIQRFEDVIAWQRAKTLVIEIRKEFGNLRDLSFKDQIYRASISTTNNIAEGFDRATNKELGYFLHIARGSNAEVRSMLIVARELNYASEEKSLELIALSEEVSKLLSGFIRSLKTDHRFSGKLTTIY